MQWFFTFDLQGGGGDVPLSLGDSKPKGMQTCTGTPQQRRRHDSAKRGDGISRSAELRGIQTRERGGIY